MTFPLLLYLVILAALVLSIVVESVIEIRRWLRGLAVTRQLREVERRAYGERQRGIDAA